AGNLRIGVVSEELGLGIQQPGPIHQGSGLLTFSDPGASHFVRTVLGALSRMLRFSPAQEFRALPDCTAGPSLEDVQHLSLGLDLLLMMKVRVRHASTRCSRISG